jgi:hypothetical protein
VLAVQEFLSWFLTENFDRGAADADLTFTGSGNNDYDFVGSLIAKSIKLNGHFMLHFDEDLLTDWPSRGYTATHWTEI